MIVVTTAYQRPAIFEKFLQNVPFPLIVAGDELNEAIWNRNDHKGEYIVTDNKPLGKKWNTALKACEKYINDYVIITGSDDFFSLPLWEWYLTLDVHYAGLLDFYFHDKGRVKYFRGYSMDRFGEPNGAGRALHRNVLETLDYELWEDELNIGLDASMTKKLNLCKGITHNFIKLSEHRFVAVDDKSEGNLHSINEYQGDWLNEKEAKWVLSQI